MTDTTVPAYGPDAEFDNWIAGRWVGSDDRSANVNPSDTSDVLGRFARADASTVEQAIAAAREALPAWSTGPVQQRFDILDAAGTALKERAGELGELLAREEGKQIAEATAEVTRAAQIFKFFAGETLRNTGEIVESVRPGLTVEMTHEPVGVVGIVTPWNFPIAIPAWKIAPALAYGNTVVLKPADLVPGSAWALVDILHRAGAPAGVVNLVMGRGSVVGETFIRSPDVAAISFTGSVDTGRRIAAACGEGMKKFQLEMGGKNPLVVLDDADLKTAVNCAVQGAFYSTGQRCTASSRLIVTKGIHDRFVDAVTAEIRELKVDDALKPGTQIGPVVDERQLDQDLGYIGIAKDEGAKLAWGGERLNRETPGFYLQPALFTETRNEMRINREEVFGPVATVIRAEGYEEALAIANDTEFGLVSGICTASLKHAQHFRQHCETGMAMVNLPTAGVDYHVPFGGRKGSSYGTREQGRYAVEFYTTVKTSYVLPV